MLQPTGGAAYGAPDLNLWIREVEDVVREIIEDPIFKGNQNFHFEMDLDELGERIFGGKANALVRRLVRVARVPDWK